VHKGGLARESTYCVLCRCAVTAVQSMHLMHGRVRPNPHSTFTRCYCTKAWMVDTKMLAAIQEKCSLCACFQGLPTCTQSWPAPNARVPASKLVGMRQKHAQHPLLHSTRSHTRSVVAVPYFRPRNSGLWILRQGKVTFSTLREHNHDHFCDLCTIRATHMHRHPL